MTADREKRQLSEASPLPESTSSGRLHKALAVAHAEAKAEYRKYKMFALRYLATCGGYLLRQYRVASPSTLHFRTSSTFLFRASDKFHHFQYAPFRYRSRPRLVADLPISYQGSLPPDQFPLRYRLRAQLPADRVLAPTLLDNRSENESPGSERWVRYEQKEGFHVRR